MERNSAPSTWAFLSIVCPKTLKTLPKSSLPTGTSKGLPVSMTVEPLARPWVGVRATPRTVLLSSWVKTSMITCSLSPALRTLRIEGALGKWTSTTLLRTDKTFPLLTCSLSTFISSYYKIYTKKLSKQLFQFSNVFHKPTYDAADHNKH